MFQLARAKGEALLAGVPETFGAHASSSIPFGEMEEGQKTIRFLLFFLVCPESGGARLPNSELWGPLDYPIKPSLAPLGRRLRVHSWPAAGCVALPPIPGGSVVSPS